MSKHSLNVAKIPPYSLPKLYGWHMLPQQELKETGKIFQYFGANWWDLLLDGKLPLKKGEISVKTKDAHAIIMINLGSKAVKMENSFTGDVYNVMPGKRSTVNNTFDKKITLTSSDEENEMHLTKIGSIWIIMLNIQEIEDGESFIKKSDIFNDFLLMTGIPDKDQYMNTLGLETFDYMDVKGWKLIDSDKGAKNHWIELILEQWDRCNPRKKAKAPEGIPKKVQWIWLRRDPRKMEFGKLKPVFYKFMDTWIERNPGFEYNLWTDNPDFVVPKKYEDVITVKGPDEIEKILNKLPKGKVRDNIRYMYENHLNVGARSDTLRQCILYYDGGIYADVNDGACLAPMEKMMDKFDFIIGMEPVMYVNNAIIGAKKGHIINQAMIAWLADEAEDLVDEWENDYIDAEQEEKDDYIVSTTGPIAMTNVIFGLMLKERGGMDHSLFLPSSWIYPNYFIPESPTVWLKPVSITAHFDRRDYLK